MSGLHDSGRDAVSLRLYLLYGACGGLPSVRGGSPLRNQGAFVYGGCPVSTGAAAGSRLYSALLLGNGRESDTLCEGDTVGGI